MSMDNTKISMQPKMFSTKFISTTLQNKKRIERIFMANNISRNQNTTKSYGP